MFPPALVRSESGQSLVLITLAMGLIVALAAFSIDVAQWNVGRHKAQVTADATALAAANCLASGTCKSTSTTPPGGDAEQAGDAISNDNGFPTSAVTMSISSSAVDVTIKTSVASSFAGFFGMPSENVSATAVASYKPPTSNSCSTPGDNCAAVFAMDQSCSNTDSEPGGSPIVFNGAGDTIQGIVHSNGSIYEAGGGNQTLGPTTFGNTSSSCEIDTSHETGDTWNGSSTMPTVGEAPLMTWPDNYATILAPCGGTGQVACTGPCINANLNSSYSSSSPTPAISPDPCTPTASGSTDSCAKASDGCTGTPAYCTQGAASYTFGNGAASLPTNNVWCAFGSGSPSDPNTYTGLIEFQSGGLGSSSTPIQGTWIGGTIDVDHTSYLSTQSSTPTYPVFYSAGSGNCSSGTSGGACMTAQNNEINGAIFAPKGMIQFNGDGTTTDNFLEGMDIDFIGQNQSILGEGPTSISGVPTPGSDSLSG